ncbi:hypothetical protein AGIG_G24318 [Arapaima gigas]
MGLVFLLQMERTSCKPARRETERQTSCPQRVEKLVSSAAPHGQLCSFSASPRTTRTQKGVAAREPSPRGSGGRQEGSRFRPPSVDLPLSPS